MRAMLELVAFVMTNVGRCGVASIAGDGVLVVVFVTVELIIIAKHHSTIIGGHY